MRPKYSTRGIVLARAPLAEASALLYVLTADFGLVRARAQGVRKPGAKLASAVQTFRESEVMLVRGKDGWRLSGANLVDNRLAVLQPGARNRAGRIAQLTLRLVHGETNDPALFDVFMGFLEALPTLDETEADAAECLVALRLLRTLGLDAGEVPGGESSYEKAVLDEATLLRNTLILRINRGIGASGL